MEEGATAPPSEPRKKAADAEPVPESCSACFRVSTFIAYNHDNGEQTAEVLKENFEVELKEHHALEADLAREVERLREFLKSALRHMYNAVVVFYEPASGKVLHSLPDERCMFCNELVKQVEAKAREKE